MNENQDPILAALACIEGKVDDVHDVMDVRLAQIHTECKRTAATRGAIAGGVAGGLVSTGIALIKAKLGML